jgi:CRISPR-associated endonuclease/helicase Cas3
MATRPERLVAHTPPEGSDDWHYLDEHSLEVAEMAAEFAEPFGAQDVARWLGLLHDAGKAHPDFQEYLWKNYCEPKTKHNTVDHKTAGAAVLSTAKDLPQVLLGHHGGLSDLSAVTSKMRNAVTEDMERLKIAWDAFQSLEITPSGAPPPTPGWASASPESHEFYLRMLFSCLVDADVLSTERHWTRDAAEIRKKETPTIPALWDRFREDQAALVVRVAGSSNADSLVNRIRADVYDACLDRASWPPGFFRLTVPTGGGKTRSATAFALSHAIKHRMKRVIYGVPFLTITEQTVDVLRGAVGSDRAVLENHSAIEPEYESASGEETEDERWRQLASENWDAPIIVTTTVQLFESLFGRKTRRCRKLHNIARSVIILDEFQTIPSHLRESVFDVLKELVTNYGVSVVFCTATQPVLDTIEDELVQHGIAVTELAPDPEKAFRALERVCYEWPAQEEPWGWDRVAKEMQETEQVLTIVNTVRHASELFAALNDDDAFHLSTRMCGAHRRDTLRRVRERLHANHPCRVVSTQLVEAGVDIDFPVVLRAMGPLDRIAQAAGRCNREGMLPSKGRTVVFGLEDDVMPGGAYRIGTGVTSMMLAVGQIDFTDPTTFETYFRMLYADAEADERDIQHYRAERFYEEVADRFRIIDDDTFPLIVEYDDAACEAKQRLKDAARRPDKRLKRALRDIQPYVVTCRTYERGRFEAACLVEEIRPGIWEWLGDYDDNVGIIIPAGESTKGVRLAPERLCVW